MAPMVSSSEGCLLVSVHLRLRVGRGVDRDHYERRGGLRCNFLIEFGYATRELITS